MFLFYCFQYSQGQDFDDTTNSIVRELISVNPIFAQKFNSLHENKIVAVVNKKGINTDNTGIYSSPDIAIYLFQKFADIWQIEKSVKLFEDEFSYYGIKEPFKIVSINKKPFLYFVSEISSMGNASSASDLYFTLVSLTELKVTALNYVGEPLYDDNEKYKGLKGEFTNLDEIKSDKELFPFFESQIESSNLIYKPMKEDLDISNAKNYWKKWLLDNPELKEIIEKFNFNKYSKGKINFTYYKKNIFPKEKGSIFKQIENKYFIIISMFRNNILAYDKINKNYFPIWINNCSHGCGKDIQFINSNTILITYYEADNQKISVNLKDKTYEVVSNIEENQKVNYDTEISAGNEFYYKNVSLQSDQYELGCIGEIINKSGHNYTLVNFIISVYDDNGKLLDTSFINVSNIKNNETKSFLTYLKVKAEAIKKYKIQFENGL